MKLGRQMRTAEQREFWREVDRSSAEVSRWPAWLRGVEENPMTIAERLAEIKAQTPAASSGDVLYINVKQFYRLTKDIPRLVAALEVAVGEIELEENTKYFRSAERALARIQEALGK